MFLAIASKHSLFYQQDCLLGGGGGGGGGGHWRVALMGRIPIFGKTQAMQSRFTWVQTSNVFAFYVTHNDFSITAQSYL